MGRKKAQKAVDLDLGGLGSVAGNGRGVWRRSSGGSERSGAI